MECYYVTKKHLTSLITVLRAIYNKTWLIYNSFYNGLKPKPDTILTCGGGRLKKKPYTLKEWSHSLDVFCKEKNLKKTEWKRKLSNITQRAVSDDQIVRKLEQFRKLRLFLSLDHIVIDQMFSKCRNDCIEMIGVNNMTLYKKITVEEGVVWKEERLYNSKSEVLNQKAV